MRLELVKWVGWTLDNSGHWKCLSARLQELYIISFSILPLQSFLGLNYHLNCLSNYKLSLCYQANVLNTKFQTLCAEPTLTVFCFRGIGQVLIYTNGVQFPLQEILLSPIFKIHSVGKSACYQTHIVQTNFKD